MRTNKQIKIKPVLVLVADRHGDAIYPPSPAMMRDHLGLSQRQLASQATRETMPREVTTKPGWPVLEKPQPGWLARLAARIWR